MKKYLAGLLCLALVAGILGAGIAGCGSSPATNLIKSADQAFTDASTYRVKGTTTSTVDGISDTTGQSGTLDASFTMEMQKADNGFNQHRIDTAQNDVVETYIIGDRLYMGVPGQGWYYGDIGNQAAQQDITSVSPENLQTILKYITKSSITAEDDATTTLAVQVSQDYLFDVFKQLNSAQQASGSTSTNLLSQLSDYIKDANMDVTMRVEKGTNRLQEISLTMKISFKPIDQGPQSASMTFATDAQYYDYNTALQLTLPADAQNAQPLSALQNQQTPSQTGQ